MSAPYLCYVLRGVKGQTYVGITNNFARRLRQHNGEIKGGARYTKMHRPWSVLVQVRGFRSKREALRFEWAMKHRRRSMKGASPEQIRYLTLEYLLSAPAKESTAQMIKDLKRLDVTVYCSQKRYQRLIGARYGDQYKASPHKYTFLTRQSS